MKACFKCGARKPLDEFYKHPAMADGHLGKCKECTKLDVRRHRKDNPEKVRAYDRERSTQAHRVELNIATTREYRARFPERVRANAAVAYAVRTGKLQKWPCMCCEETRVEGHHPDYSSPLDVVWLCAAHHGEIHLAHPD